MRAWTILLLLACVGCGPTVVGRTARGADIVQIPLQLSNVYLVKTNTPVLVDSGTIGDEHDLQAALADQGMCGNCSCTGASCNCPSGTGCEFQCFNSCKVTCTGPCVVHCVTGNCDVKCPGPPATCAHDNLTCNRNCPP